MNLKESNTVASSQNVTELTINSSHLLRMLNKPNKIIVYMQRYEFITYPLTLWLLVLFMAIVTVTAFTHIVGIVSSAGGGFYAWDGGLFLRVIKLNYIDLNSAPFFPLLPLLMRFLHYITKWPLTDCGFVITNAAYLLGMIFFYQLMLKRFEQETARRALWLLVMFPPAMFFNAMYSESLTLLTTVLFFFCLDRNHWYAAMFSGFFAACAHTLGVILVVAGLLHLLKQQELSRRVFWQRFFSLGIIAGGLLLYMLYLQMHFHNAFAFIIAERFWHRTATIPLVNIFRYFAMLLQDPHLGISTLVFTINGLCTLVMAVMGAIMLFAYRDNRNISSEMKVFFVLTLLASICSGSWGGSLESYGRFMIVLFPGFIVWADKMRNSSLFLFILAIMMPLKTLLLGMFVSGYPVT